MRTCAHSRPLAPPSDPRRHRGTRYRCDCPSVTSLTTSPTAPHSLLQYQWAVDEHLERKRRKAERRAMRATRRAARAAAEADRMEGGGETHEPGAGEIALAEGGDGALAVDVQAQGS